ncbi:MAG: electron-transfer flavoprotein:ubiquinone oxidoreductase [Bacteroidota bacterium]|nr:electron-transfer flavoprotein:ubiquinone oxidoreductase [Bacteroidota bacterium]
MTVKTDVLIIGGGPSGLSFAIRLADLLKEKGMERRILLIDKGSSIGSHIISGALVRPGIFSELLPDTPLEEIPFDSKVSSNKMYMLSEKGKLRIPITPPYMGNKGHYTASLGELCRFLASKAEEKGVEIYPGFAMSDILYDEKGKVIGAKTIDTGVDQQGNRMENFQEGTPVEAKLTIFAEGSRGSLAKKLIRKFNLDQGRNPQIYSLGCKEVWSVPEGNIAPGEVYNTMGFPASDFGAFGGGFIYGLKENKVALGLVIGLDYADPTFDTHNAFQIWKKHPFVSQFLKGGKILEYGAKTLPEGGYYAVPKLFTDNALIVGDSAGLLAMPALKGIHLAVHSGMIAAQAALEALEKNDFSEKTLQTYEQLMKESTVYSELHRNRNFRQGFVKGMIPGMFHFGTQLISGGAGFCGRLKNHSDSEATKRLAEAKKPLFKEKYKGLEFDKELTFDKVTDVYYTGVAHDDHQVPHLRVNDPETFNAVNIKEYGAPCQYYCSAEVYEVHTDREGKQELRIHFENCLHCKTCDIKEPAGGITWNVPYGGNGPDYKYM